MPYPNEHACRLLDPSTPKDRVRSKSQDFNGKQARAIYFIKDNKATMQAVRFPKSTWSANEARAVCETLGGTFEPAAAVAATARIVFDGKGGASGFTPAIIEATGTEPAEDGLFWHPMIPLGKFTHPAYGEFETTHEDALEMIANFEAGLPGPKGIPIDQNAEHLTRGDGAYGWVKSLEIRDNTLWMGIEWTEDGIAAVSSNRLPYVSPYWVTGKHTHPTYNARNLVIAVALCTRPFFFEQPELQVAASEFTQVLDNTAAKDVQIATGGTDMPASLEMEARDKYVALNGAVTDDEWKKLTEGFDKDEDWQEFMASLETEGEGADDKPADTPTDTPATAPATASATDLEALKTEKEEAEARAAAAEAAAAEAVNKLEAAEAEAADLNTRVASLETERDEAKIRAELAATDLGDNRRYSPVAIDLLVTQRLNPSPEAAIAIEAHMKENGGQMETVPMGEYPGVTMKATASGDMADEDWWAEKKQSITEHTIKGTEAVAADEKLPYREAYIRFIDAELRG